MRARVLAVGADPTLLETRQAVLASGGYEAVVATPQDVDQKLAAEEFDLVILSMMLGEKQQKRIQAKLPAGTKALLLESLVQPEDLLKMVANELGCEK
jgi:DNA-binding response OmpR family regulator